MCITEVEQIDSSQMPYLVMHTIILIARNSSDPRELHCDTRIVVRYLLAQQSGICSLSYHLRQSLTGDWQAMIVRTYSSSGPGHFAKIQHLTQPRIGYLRMSCSFIPCLLCAPLISSSQILEVITSVIVTDYHRLTDPS